MIVRGKFKERMNKGRNATDSHFVIHYSKMKRLLVKAMAHMAANVVGVVETDERVDGRVHV